MVVLHEIIIEGDFARVQFVDDKNIIREVVIKKDELTQEKIEEEIKKYLEMQQKIEELKKLTF